MGSWPSTISAGRPLQPGDRRARRGRAQGRRAREVGLRHGCLPLTDIQAFHADGGGEFDDIAIDDLLRAFGIERSLSRKGCPYDNAVDEPANKILKTELVHRESFSTLHELQVKLNDHVRWHSRFRLHSKLGYVSPVEFGNAGLSP